MTVAVAFLGGMVCGALLMAICVAAGEGFTRRRQQSNVVPFAGRRQGMTASSVPMRMRES